MKVWRGGFTLIELLVVIAIIAILSSLLFPGLSRARTRARMIEEMSAGRQVLLAAQMYADDCGGAVFPGYATSPAVDDRGQLLLFPINARYPWRLMPYLAGSMPLIYSGENRVRLQKLRTQAHGDYVYAVSVYPSLGINSYFIGGNESEFPALGANQAFGVGTVITKVSDTRHPSQLMSFISARSAVNGSEGQGYFQVIPPYLKARQWAPEFSASIAPTGWGFVAPRFHRRAVAALMDGHVEAFGLQDMQDMRHWCNTADRPDFTLQSKP